jgi:DNA-binding IclR family transcriptional regulator
MNPAELIPKAHDVMLQMEAQIGQTIGLGQLVEDSLDVGVAVAVVEGTAGVSYHIEANYCFPLHTSAPGKVLLAYLPPAERNTYLGRMEFKRYTPSTIVSRTDFEAELDNVMEKGYAIDVSEQLEGCHCVGVPVFDAAHHVVASLWTTAPSSQLPVRNFGKVADILRVGTQDICTRISSSRRASNRDYINSVVEQAQKVIKNNLHRPLDVEELASNLYVGYSWFRKVFKEKTGLAPAAFHQQLRLEKARHLLAESDCSVREISESLGFRNQNHFSALFKRKMDTSPSAFRNNG